MSRASSIPLLVKHYQRILTRWPKDPLRPTVSFQSMLQKHIDKLAKPLDAPADNVEANAAQATIPPKIDANDEMGRVNALYAMMENKASEEIPLPKAVFTPQSNPSYYADLERELAAAPDRSWFGRQWEKMKGFVRLQ